MFKRKLNVFMANRTIKQQHLIKDWEDICRRYRGTRHYTQIHMVCVDWLNRVEALFGDPPTRCGPVVEQYYNECKEWKAVCRRRIEEDLMDKTPKSLEPKEVQPLEQYDSLLKTLYNNGKTYVHMLTDNTYTVRELYAQITSWLNNVDFLRPIIGGTAYYPEISECEDVLRNQLETYQRAEAVDSVEGPGEEKAPERKCYMDCSVNELGDRLYDDACGLLIHITDGDMDTRKLCHDIQVWMCEFTQHTDELEHHSRIVHLRDLCTRFTDFLRGVDRAGSLMENENKEELLHTGEELLAEMLRVVSVMKKWLMKFEDVDSNCISAMGPELTSTYHRIENYVVGTENVSVLTDKLAKLSNAYDCSLEHIKTLQEQIDTGIEKFDVHKEFKENTLQLIKNLCTLLEHH